MIKHFGMVEANISDEDRQVELRFHAPGKQPLGEQMRQKCLQWALASLADLEKNGYVIQLPGAAQNN